MVVLLLPTQILPSSRLTEPRELLPEWPQPLVKLLRLSPQALVFGALEKLPSARPAEARWLLPELVPESLPELPPDSLHALETAVLLLPTLPLLARAGRQATVEQRQSKPSLRADRHSELSDE